ncbi:Uncharacterised protein [uncultured archaeon]|nr:Uncharacterised protein [uncultured archaeon]
MDETFTLAFFTPETASVIVAFRIIAVPFLAAVFPEV